MHQNGRHGTTAPFWTLTRPCSKNIFEQPEYLIQKQCDEVGLLPDQMSLCFAISGQQTFCILEKQSSPQLLLPSLH